jgi:hypothetical protein
MGRCDVPYNAIAVEDDKVIVGCRLWIDTSNTDGMPKLEADTQGLQCSDLK